jgi:Ca2+-binding EF-hand superfamily protein
MEMERAAALVFHRHKLTLEDGQEVIPGPALTKATRSLTLCIPQADIDQASRDAEEPFALSRSEFVALCCRFESTCVDLAKLRDDLEVLAKHGSGKICRDDLRSILLCAGEGFDDAAFDEFFDMTDQSQELKEFAEIDDVLALMDPFRLSRLLEALEVDETSGRNFKTMRSEPTERQLILDQEERERAEVPQRERAAAEKRRKEEERRMAMPPVPATAPVLTAKPRQTSPQPQQDSKPIPVQKAKAKSGCC